VLLTARNETGVLAIAPVLDILVFAASGEFTFGAAHWRPRVGVGYNMS
jgi:hypothetical protein